MARLTTHHLLIAGCTVVAMASACTTGKSTTGAPAPGQAAAGAKPADPRVTALRKALSDPPVGQSVTVNRYWNISKSAPFDVDGFSAKTTAGAGDIKIITATAQVRLPRADAFKAVAKAKPSFKAAQTAADPAADDELDDELDQDNPYAAEDFTDAEEAEVLESPHAVTMTIADRPTMSDADDQTTFTDTVDGRKLVITNDQDWTRFKVTGADGNLTVIFNPDGTYQVDGKPAATEDDAVDLLLAHPVVTGASPYAWALAAARTGRIGQETATLASSRQGGEVSEIGLPMRPLGFTTAAGGGADGIALAHSLLDNLMRHLLKVDG